MKTPNHHARAHRAVSNRAAAVLYTGVVAALFAVGATLFPVHLPRESSGGHSTTVTARSTRIVLVTRVESTTLGVARHVR
jgi:hypothetical protein